MKRIKALIAGEPFTLNGHQGKGAPVIVTYAFPKQFELTDDPELIAANAALKKAVRVAIKKFEDVAGIKFVEVGINEAEMIGVARTKRADGLSWADLPATTEADPQTIGRVAINTIHKDLKPGSAGFEAVLHEIGRAVGLKHPSDGRPRLPDRLDNTDYTVMSDDQSLPFKRELQVLDRGALRELYGEADAMRGVEVSYDVRSFSVVVKGTRRDDELLAPSTKSEIFGAGGDDLLVGRQDDDTLLGGQGRDTLFGLGRNDSLDGGGSNDLLSGGDGLDMLDGGSGNDLLEGGEGDDRLVGGTGDDTLWGQQGNDTLLGEAGQDTLSGGVGRDQLDGGSGADIIRGGEGRDVLLGGIGDDTLRDDGQEHDGRERRGSDLNDRLFGGAGNDLLHSGQGDDKLFGGAGSDTMHGEEGADLLSGQGDADVLIGGDGADVLYGGDGNDLLRGDGARPSDGSGNDEVYGQSGDDTLIGDAGRDDLRGGAGNDVLHSDRSSDYLQGGAGDDVFVVGSGRAKLRGDGGADRFRFDQNSGDSSISDFDLEEGDRIDVRPFDWTIEEALDNIVYEPVGRGPNLRLDLGDAMVAISGIGPDDVSADMFIV